MGAASTGMQQEEYQGFKGAPKRQTNQVVDPNSREATLSRKNNLLFSGLVLATITGKHTYTHMYHTHTLTINITSK